jgi:hypothetical protein
LRAANTRYNVAQRLVLKLGEVAKRREAGGICKRGIIGDRSTVDGVTDRDFRNLA